MEKKPKLAYLLFALWFIVGFLFLGAFVTQLMSHWDYLELAAEYQFLMSGITADIVFSYVSLEILYLAIAIFAYILADAAYYNKKWCWLTGIIYTSALAFSVYLRIYMIGLFIIQGSFTGLGNFQVIVYISMIFLVPSLLYILLRPEIRTYFGKT